MKKEAESSASFFIVCEAKRIRTGQKRVLSRFSRSGEKGSVAKAPPEL